MKKTIAVIGSAAALSFAGAGLAAAQDVDTLDDDTGAPQGVQVETTQNDDEPGDGENGNDDEVDTPEEVSDIAMQLCGTISAYDFLGSAGSFVPGLEGEECEANADAAIEAAMSGDIGGALDILRGIEAELPDDAVDTGSAGLLDGFDSLSGAPEGDDAGDAEPVA
ncbi:hypothetical protein ACWIE7_09500 [Dietzia sp. NPDC055343]